LPRSDAVGVGLGIAWALIIQPLCITRFQPQPSLSCSEESLGGAALGADGQAPAHACERPPAPIECRLWAWVYPHFSTSGARIDPPGVERCENSRLARIERPKGADSGPEAVDNVGHQHW
jgi:hypothetical protein